MDFNILLAGIGGQGVLFAHQLLAECAITQGLNVTGAETHGMSQRGGSVVSHLKIGNMSAPLIRQGTADLILAFDASEAYRNLSFIRGGGTVIVNYPQNDFPSEQVSKQLRNIKAGMRVLDADGIAKRLGRVSAANIALLGFASTHTGFPLSRETLRETVTRIGRPQSLETNLLAFDEGARIGIENP